MAVSTLRMEAKQTSLAGAPEGSVDYSASPKLKVLISHEAVIGGFSALSLRSTPPLLRREQIHDNSRETYSFPADAAIMPHTSSKNIFKLDGNGCIHGKHTDPPYYHQWSSAHTLHAVAEDKPLEETPSSMLEDLDDDSLSSSPSFSSLSDTPFETFSSSSSSSSSSDNFQNLPDIDAAMETQSSSKRDSDGIPSFVAGSPPLARRSLSKFYAGKSRSFSCVRDVVSVEELAKPANPYARRLKQHKYHNLDANRLRMLPAQKGSALISKKSAQGGKTTLALGMAMSTKAREYQSLVHEDDLQTLLPPRSFSLSDLRLRGEHYL